MYPVSIECVITGCGRLTQKFSSHTHCAVILYFYSTHTTIPCSHWVGTCNNLGQERDIGMGTCTIQQRLLKQMFSTLKRNRTWQDTVPETSAKVYGTCCTSKQHHVYCNVLVQCVVVTQHEWGIDCHLCLKQSELNLTAQNPYYYYPFIFCSHFEWF